jgi:hypothetical protein
MAPGLFRSVDSCSRADRLLQPKPVAKVLYGYPENSAERSSAVCGIVGSRLGLAPDDSARLPKDARKQDVYALDWKEPQRATTFIRRTSGGRNFHLRPIGSIGRVTTWLPRGPRTEVNKTEVVGSIRVQ